MENVLTKKIKYFSLFSGIGGFELGILRFYRKKNQRGQEDSQGNDEERKGLESSKRQRDSAENGWNGEQPNSNSNSRATCIGFSEIDKYAIQIYKKHFNHKEYGDVSRIKWNDVPNFTLLVGGFPCQSFSIAGKRGGFADTRGTLFFEIARCLRKKQPRLLLLENVKGLLSHDKGRTFGVILNTLDELGYDLQWQVLNSKNFGVPQNRERVFIIGHLRGTSRPEVFPIEGRTELDRKTQQEDRKKVQTHRCLEATEYKNYSSERFDGVLQDVRVRRLTPTECERLQSFPDGWTEFGMKECNCGTCDGYITVPISDTQRYKCLGNAVTVNVIEAIMEKLL